MKHILLVHYDEILSNTLRDLLEIMDYVPLVATNGDDAIAKVKAGYEPDLLMLDLNMHGLVGANTLPLLRTLKPKLPVLITAGRVDRLVQDFAKAHSGVALLAKPFTMAELRYHLAEFG